MIIVSACLAGLNTRYDGKNKSDDWVLSLVKSGKAIPVCPEQLGGLPTPRPKAEIKNGDGIDVICEKAKVLSEDGDDLSDQFIKGAHEVLKLAEMINPDEAILKNGSPSCGVDFIKKKDKKIKGLGITAALLSMRGIVIKGL